MKIETVDLGAGEQIPEDSFKWEAVFIFGGPMNVYEEEKYPYLKEEDSFIQSII